MRDISIDLCVIVQTICTLPINVGRDVFEIDATRWSHTRLISRTSTNIRQRNSRIHARGYIPINIKAVYLAIKTAQH